MFFRAVSQAGRRCYRLIQKRYYSPQLRYIHDMVDQKVIVTHETDTRTVGISFRYSDEEKKVDRIFNFQRSTEEEVGNILNRIVGNIQKALTKKNKKKRTSPPVEEEDEVPVKLVKLSNGEAVSDDMSCYDSFVGQASNHNLLIGSSSYSIDLNPPIVKTIDLPKNIMAGYSLYPTKIEMMYGKQEECRFQWFKSDKKFENNKEASSTLQTVKWLENGSDRICHTTADDVGRVLKMAVTPYDGERQGERAEAVATVVVTAGPGECPFHRRQQQFTSELAPEDCLRVVSYNILADLYADSDFARNNLFPSCPPYAIAMDYRKQLLISEIIGYLGDVVCLQEVDEKVFNRDLAPALSAVGLDGYYTAKGGQVTEGVALFYRKEKLRLLEKNRVVLSNELQKNALFADIWAKVEAVPDLKKRILDRGTILQMSVLESVGSVSGSERIVVVGGTHLYFYPDADHIRLIQAGLSLTLLRQVMQLYKIKYPEKDVSLLFCGDFNSTPDFGVYRLMRQQWIAPDDSDWTSCAESREHVQGITLNHDLEIDSACGLPQYTNYTPNFNGCLDYIYYQSDKFNVKQNVPLPSHDEVTEHKALPSPTFPSDHIPLIADLQFKPK